MCKFLVQRVRVLGNIWIQVKEIFPTFESREGEFIHFVNLIKGRNERRMLNITVYHIYRGREAQYDDLTYDLYHINIIYVIALPQTHFSCVLITMLSAGFSR